SLLPIYPQPAATSGGVHPQHPHNSHKASTDLKQKIDRGRGDDLVRVIIQPAGEWNPALESTVQDSGGRDVRQFPNFRLRVVTMCGKAAAALATREDIGYVSLNREVRSLGHVSLTTGADAVRSWNCSSSVGFDGAGIGIAVLDSGIDPDHMSFIGPAN